MYANEIQNLLISVDSIEVVDLFEQAAHLIALTFERLIERNAQLVSSLIILPDQRCRSVFVGENQNQARSELSQINWRNGEPLEQAGAQVD